MSIELSSQLPIDELLQSVKSFKRNGERISELVRSQQMTEAMALLKQ
jgi:hypothetical protein